ncbi:MAG: hypothetical protein ACHQVS_04620 [Candidatus Babeliales bacterium]
MKVISRIFILFVSLSSLFCTTGFLRAMGGQYVPVAVPNQPVVNQRECSICAENKPVDDFTRLTCCNQEIYCNDCLAKTRDKRCPNCRAPFDGNGMKATIQNKYKAKHFPNQQRRLYLARGVAACMVIGGLYYTYRIGKKIYAYNPDNYEIKTFTQKIEHTFISGSKSLFSLLFSWFPERVFRLLDEGDYQIHRIWNPAMQYPGGAGSWQRYKNFTALLGYVACNAFGYAGLTTAVYKKVVGPQLTDLPAIFN